MSSELQPALQAAGHKGAKTSSSGELFFKPTTAPEFEFYNELQNHPEWLDIVPTYYGSLTESDSQSDAVDVAELVIKQVPTFGDTNSTDATGEAPKADNGKKLLVLQSAMFGITQPAVLDCKLGSQLWDENAPQEKRDRLDKVAQETTSSSLSVRIAGMSTWSGTRTDYGKQFGRDLKTEEFTKVGLSSFFPKEGENTSTADLDLRNMILEYFVGRMDVIIQVLEKEEFEMRSASVFMVYEADKNEFKRKLELLAKLQEQEEQEASAAEGNGDEDEDDDEKPTSEDIQDQLFKLVLIDFAHTKFTPGKGPDTGVLKGLHTVLNGLKQLQPL